MNIKREEFDALVERVDFIERYLRAWHSRLAAFDTLLSRFDQFRSKVIRSFKMVEVDVGGMKHHVHGLASFTGGLSRDVSSLRSRVQVTESDLYSVDLELEAIQRAASGNTAAVLLANMSFVALLAASAYRDAHEHVNKTVSGNESVRRGIYEFTTKLPLQLVIGGLNAYTAGVAGNIIGNILGPLANFAVAKVKSTRVSGPPLRPDKWSSSTGRKGGLQPRDVGLSPGGLESAGSWNLDQTQQNYYATGSSVAGNILAPVHAGINWLVPAGFKAGDLIDPTQFFMGLELKFREWAARLAGTTSEVDLLEQESDSYIQRMQNQVKRLIGEMFDKKSLLHKEEEHSHAFLLLPMGQHEAQWAALKRSITTYMRRLCWRSYCRARWRAGVERYAVRAEKTDKAPDYDWIRLPAEKWPHQVWQKERGSFPAHWNQICSDFRGAEHDNETDRKYHTWISMAVVHCCQVQRGDLKSTLKIGRIRHSSKFLIDLEHNRFAAGHELGPVQISTHVSDSELLFSSLPKTGALLDAIHQIRTKGGEYVSIQELRTGKFTTTLFGKTIDSKATGKKGMTKSPTAELRTTSGSKITVILQSTHKNQFKKVEVEFKNSSGRTLLKETTNFATHRTQFVNFTAPRTTGRYVIALSGGNRDLRDGKMFRSALIVDKTEWQVLVE